ncbi:receptor-type tyrosine-protein phosphatase F [Pangasianodon hypophthalmus]|uniref:receptor-type tyrosine-protein phosphatase F n=1 Tax=Pangasianodon hypophthalmus TaxID=310915 RepID=UPI00230805D4|nr:receptor-type tyrosine-protein phosphatase F [Pangasianodon hypophthalmus]
MIEEVQTWNMVRHICPSVPLMPCWLSVLLLFGYAAFPSHANSLPSFIKTPEDQTGISSGVASFVCQAVGEPKPCITWMKKVSSPRFEVIEFDDGSGSVLRIHRLCKHQDKATYECTATNSAGEIKTSAKLNVLEGRKRLSLPSKCKSQRVKLLSDRIYHLQIEIND